MSVERTTYTWSEFDLDAALAGMLVGFKNSDIDGGSHDTANLDYTGKLMRDTSNTGTPYKITIGGIPMWVNSSGVVKICANSTFANKTLYIITAEISQSVGTSQPLTKADEGYEDVITISSLEPRDQFAMHTLNTLLAKLDHPETFDDASIMQICAAAYRWANGMMQAAADVRKAIVASGGTPSSTLDVDTSELTNSEKLLYNIKVSLDDLKTQQNTNATANNGKMDTLATKLENIKSQQQTMNTNISTVGTKIDDLKAQTATNTTNRNNATLKIDNPSGDTFDVNGAGGGVVNIDELLTYSGTPRETGMSNILGFVNKASKWTLGEMPIKGSTGSLLSQIEAAQADSTNNSAYYWLRKSGNTVITGISDFLGVYSQDIYNDQKANWRADIVKAVNSALADLGQDNQGLTIQNTYFNNFTW